MVAPGSSSSRLTVSDPRVNVRFLRFSPENGRSASGPVRSSHSEHFEFHPSVFRRIQSAESDDSGRRAAAVTPLAAFLHGEIAPAYRPVDSDGDDRAVRYPHPFELGV